MGFFVIIMIKINVVAVGKIKEKYFSSGIEEYLKRISKYAKITVCEVLDETFIEPKTTSEVNKILEAEADNIIKKLRGVVICLCIEGEKVSSKKFASIIKNYVDRGNEITFVIGGSYGISERVKQLSLKRLSFSDMTFPHTMARLMLTEQIYRAFTIINNSTYHK